MESRKYGIEIVFFLYQKKYNNNKIGAWLIHFIGLVISEVGQICLCLVSRFNKIGSKWQHSNQGW